MNQALISIITSREGLIRNTTLINIHFRQRLMLLISVIVRAASRHLFHSYKLQMASCKGVYCWIFSADHTQLPTGMPLILHACQLTVYSGTDQYECNQQIPAYQTGVILEF